MIKQNKNINDPILNNDEDEDSAFAVDLEADDKTKINQPKQKAKTEINNGNNVTVPKSKMVLVKKLLQNVKENNDRLIQLLSDFIAGEEEIAIAIGQISDEKFEPTEEALEGGRVIEGVFDGENMIGPDGKQYSVPANYASKSKLVEGDILKLTITANGTFVYKQIGPIERSRIVGVLDRVSTGEYYANADGKKWRLLTASVTYFKGEPGDEVVILIPKTGESKWAAVENIVKKVE